MDVSPPRWNLPPDRCPLYAKAKDLFDTTLAVAVAGATFEETNDPLDRLKMARQCCKPRFNGWDAGSPKFGVVGRWLIVHPPIGRKNATYSPCLLGGYIVPTTLYKNLKNPLIGGFLRIMGYAREV